VNPQLSIFGRIDNLANEHYPEVFGFPALGRAAYGDVKGAILEQRRPLACEFPKLRARV
jgi:hypothetical protein